MLLYSQQLTVRGRSPRMHFRVYKTQKIGSQDSFALDKEQRHAVQCHFVGCLNHKILPVLWNVCFLKKSHNAPQNQGTFMVTVFPYQKIHPIFWNTSTQYISLHNRSFDGGILQLRNSVSMCNEPGFLTVHNTLTHNLGSWLKHSQINVTQWNVKTHSVWTALIITFQGELCKGCVGKVPYTSWVYDHGLMSYNLATVTLRYWVLNTLKTVTHQINIRDLAAM